MQEPQELTEDTKELNGESFYNVALTGSGTITEDGKYGPPMADPTVTRGLGPNRTSGGRRVDVGEANVANLETEESAAGSDDKGSQRAPAAKRTPPAAGR